MSARHPSGPAAGVSLYVPRMDAFLNHWFPTYEEARAWRQAEGGYLFPHRGQFFVTGPAAVRELGLVPDDPNWEKIGWDWVRPRDREAWECLDLRRLVAAD